MILATEELTPTAKQLFASGQVTPNSEFVVGEVSALQVVAQAAGAVNRAATRIKAMSAAGNARFRAAPTPFTLTAACSQLEAGPRRRRPNRVPTTIPPNPTSAIGHHGIVLPPEGGRASAAGTVLLTSFAPSDAVPCSTWRGPQPVAVMDAL